MKNEYIKLIKKISNDSKAEQIVDSIINGKNTITEVIYKGKEVCQRLDQM